MENFNVETSDEQSRGLQKSILGRGRHRPPDLRCSDGRATVAPAFFLAIAVRSGGWYLGGEQ